MCNNKPAFYQHVTVNLPCIIMHLWTGLPLSCNCELVLHRYVTVNISSTAHDYCEPVFHHHITVNLSSTIISLNLPSTIMSVWTCLPPSFYCEPVFHHHIKCCTFYNYVHVLQPKPHSWSSWSSGLTVMTEGSFEQQLAAAFAATHLESMCELDIDSEPHIQRMTHIVCTLGTCHFEFPRLLLNTKLRHMLSWSDGMSTIVFICYDCLWWCACLLDPVVL